MQHINLINNFSFVSRSSLLVAFLILRVFGGTCEYEMNLSPSVSRIDSYESSMRNTINKIIASRFSV